MTFENYPDGDRLTAEEEKKAESLWQAARIAELEAKLVDTAADVVVRQTKLTATTKQRDELIEAVARHEAANDARNIELAKGSKHKTYAEWYDSQEMLFLCLAKIQNEIKEQPHD